MIRKGNIVIIFCIISIGILIIVKGFLTASNRNLNGFNRKFASNPIHLYTIDLSIDPNMIAGYSNGRLWIAGSTPGNFVVMDPFKGNSTKVRIGISDALRDSIGNTYTCLVNDHFCVFFAFNLPGVVICNLESGLTITYRFQKEIFIQGEYIDTDRIVVRKYSREKGGFSFYTFYSATQRLVLRNKILPAIHDGGFSTDGQLHWDDKHNKLVYQYFYSGRWCTCDSLFSNVKWYPTIDTIRRFRIKVIRQGNYYTTEGDSQPVNSFGSVYDGKLYLLSTVKADNENYALFEKSATIDVYQISTGEYLSSFHIPVIRREKPLGFQIYASRLYVLTRFNISVFDLPKISARGVH